MFSMLYKVGAALPAAALDWNKQAKLSNFFLKNTKTLMET